jgi:hypothetical protein
MEPAVSTSDPLLSLCVRRTIRLKGLPVGEYTGIGMWTRLSLWALCLGAGVIPLWSGPTTGQQAVPLGYIG